MIFIVEELINKCFMSQMLLLLDRIVAMGFWFGFIWLDQLVKN